MADIRERWPDPPRTRQERLRLFLEQWSHVPNNCVILHSTVGVYDQPTGILMQDVRELYNLEQLSAETVSGDSPAGRMLGRLERPGEETGSGLPKFHD
jgi:hypothetical protein